MMLRSERRIVSLEHRRVVGMVLVRWERTC